jgi:hypothetical protein
MTNFVQFSKRCKMRHDFDDQIQVRYQHLDGQDYDTWVSGEEALRRLGSSEAEEQLKSLNNLSRDDLRVVLRSLPERIRDIVQRRLRDELADTLETGIGGNLIGDALAGAARGQGTAGETAASEKERWLALLHYGPFRKIVLELAYIQLEGSFPEVESGQEPDDWL